MVSGIDSASVAMSGNLNVLKKAMDTEEQLMNSILSGMGGAQNLQTQQSQPQASEQNTQAQPSKNLDILA